MQSLLLEEVVILQVALSCTAMNQVWDADVVDADDFLGRCKVRVDELKPGQTYVR